MAEDTRARLVAATVAVLAEHGIAGLSARAVGGRAEVNPALIYYHFDDLDDLLTAASREVTEARAATYAERLADVEDLQGLAAAARGLHAEERRNGNLAMLAQLLAGTRTHPGLVPVLDANFDLLAREVAATIDRLLAGTALDGVLDTRQLARTVSAGFIGIELLDTVTGEDGALFDTLDTLAAVADAVLSAGTIPTAIIRRRLSSARQPRR